MEKDKLLLSSRLLLLDLDLFNSGLSWIELSDHMLVQWALGTTRPTLMWQECVSSTWMTNTLMPLTSPLVPKPEYNWGLWDIRHQQLPHHSTDCRGAEWCPNPGVGGDPPEDHPLWWVVLRKFTDAGSACDLILFFHFDYPSKLFGFPPITL